MTRLSYLFDLLVAGALLARAVKRLSGRHLIVVLAALALRAVEARAFLVDAGAQRLLVAAERDADVGEELVHAVVQRERPFRDAVDAGLAAEDHERVGDDVDEVDVVVDDERGA